jgi:hypothetical protein
MRTHGTSLINSMPKGISYGLPVYSWIKDICFFINSLFILFYMYIVVLLMLSQLISYSVIWKVLSCDFLTHNCLFMVDLILILNL